MYYKDWCMEHMKVVYLGTDISPLEDFSGLQRSVSTVFRPFWQEDVVCGDLHKYTSTLHYVKNSMAKTEWLPQGFYKMLMKQRRI